MRAEEEGKREREGGGVQSAIILYDLELESTTHTKGKGYIEREVRGGHKGRREEE